MDLVPYFDEEIQNPSQNSRLIILHFAGSHFRYSSRYPKSEEFFKPDTHMEEYLNSIRYTDKVLGEIVTRMMNLGHPAILLYMPDHGEYLNDYRDGFYDHGTRNFLTRFEIDVPFFVVFNNAYAEKYPDEVSRLSSRALIPISHDNLSHTILGAMGIYGSNYDAQYDLTAEGFNQMPRYIVERSNKVALLEEVEFNEEKFDGIVIQED
ncbi:sulfatase-like hydrolase/transferase [Opitutia bacterium ISCC 51]|nr:sulfatase-like hydrolase/transferase [Opitutae bacterium ISCC 51]QXD28521.1 sulfatase-like hydrolase/transferase [Opitutae bacterium ISCC 52]